jgi:drug/metabolite transporter (DMT)-like permease
MKLIATLSCFGALFIPAIYMIATRGRGPAKRRMLIGAGLQTLGSIAVGALVYFAWRAGQKDYAHGWALLLPVNVISLIYYVAVLFMHARKAGK